MLERVLILCSAFDSFVSFYGSLAYGVSILSCPPILLNDICLLMFIDSAFNRLHKLQEGLLYNNNKRDDSRRNKQVPGFTFQHVNPTVPGPPL